MGPDLAAIRGPRREFDLDTPLADVFSRQATSTPDAPALIVASGETVSYAALAEQVERAAQRLAAAGIGAGCAVGVHLERSPASVAALLATWSLRAAYVPLDVAFPRRFVTTALEETRAQALVTSARARDLPRTDATILRVDGDTQPGSASGRVDALDGIAIVMYTSGTTGRQKGVLHREVQVRNRLHWMWEAYPFGDDEVMCQRSPLGVMPSMWELLGGLLHGVPTLIVPDAVVKDAPALLDALVERRVTRMTVTPTLARLLLDDERGLGGTALRVVTIGGEAVVGDLVRRLEAALPETTLLNDYGCTEVNTILHAAGTPVFAPIANLDVHLLDAQLEPAEEGELCVAGPGVAVGYLARPEETAARFVELPGGERVYRTGDLARRDADGGLELLGRTDNQVKVNGMRIEPEGVEATLAEHASVREAAVVVRSLRHGGSQLHAFVVPEPGASLDLDELRAFLADRLPPSSVPAGYDEVAELPRSDRGKLKRAALRERLAGPSAGEASTPAPAEPDDEASTPSEPARPAPASRGALTAELRAILARDVLETDEAALDSRREFHLLGLDSILGVELTRRLRERFGVELSVASTYDHPTLERLSAHLWELLADTPAPEPAPEPQPEPASAAAHELAVVGYSGRFPQADDADALWPIIEAGRDTTAVVERWDAEALYDPDPAVTDRSISKWGALLDDIAGFEPLFFGIAPAEAALMDPQQRLCLMEAWKALEHAGYSPDGFGEERVGVFVGAKKGDYANAIPRERTTAHGDVLLGADAALTASRIAYHLDLHGPCMTVDTACSSSLTALHLAGQSLLTGECDLALVGGVCVITDPHFYVSTSRLGIFSPTGHTRPFDASADGFVQGEGVVFVVLRRLADAEADTVHGVIAGSAVNQDGRTNGIGAPSAIAQRELEVDLYRRRGIDPATIGYVEAHGTGTALGDPIEVGAITEAFRAFTDETGFCGLGSLKANLGHLTAAAGLASLVKVLLCLRHGTLPPVANFERPNEHLELEGSPFFIPETAREWPSPRVAAISSFGMGGTNAHCVVREAATSEPAAGAGEPQLIVLSARTPEALEARVRDLTSWLDDSVDLRDVAFTLLAGRRHWAHRRVVVAADAAELAARLREPAPDAADDLTALDEEFGRFLVTALADQANSTTTRVEKLEALASLVARGFVFDAAALFAGGRRIPLPTYPFQTVRCWHDETPSAPAEPVGETLPDTVVELVSGLLGVPGGDLDRHAPLTGYGLDSIKTITLKHDLEARLHRDVPMEVIGSSTTLEDLLAGLAADGNGNGHDTALEDASEEELDRMFAALQGGEDR